MIFVIISKNVFIYNIFRACYNCKYKILFVIRHTHATILLSQGVDIKTISERLGHADIQTTLNIYADVLKELDEQSANKIDNL